MAKPPGKDRFDASTKVQALVFDKQRFSASAARTWAVRNGFRAPATEETLHTLRLRQSDAGRFKPGTFRTIEMDDGVLAVIGVPYPRGKATVKEKNERKTPSIMDTAKKWIRKATGRKPGKKKR